MISRMSIYAALASAMLAGTSAMASTVVYSNDFTSGAGAEWSNNSTVTSNGQAFLGANQDGTLAHGFGAGTDTLTLNGLAAHTSVTVSFDLYIIQTWDGNGPNGSNTPATPDAFQLAENANSLFAASFANFTSGNTQSFGGGTPGAYITTGNFAPRTGQNVSEAGQLGFGTADNGDATYNFTFTFSDANSALALAFTSTQNQAPGDEGWGLDNVIVSTNADTTVTAAPLPASVWAGGLMLAALAAGTKIRRRVLA
jgi:hypothetical protein